MSNAVTKDLDLNSTIEKVWQAITDSETIARWMMFKTNDFKPEIGHAFQFKDAPGYDGVIECKVTELDEPHKLAYTWETDGWDGNRHSTLVTITLSESGDGGTHLNLEQSGFKPEATQEFQGAEYAWDAMLAQLQGVLG